MITAEFINLVVCILFGIFLTSVLAEIPKKYKWDREDSNSRKYHIYKHRTNISIMLMVIIMPIVFFIVNDCYVTYMRPGVDQVYSDFRKNPYGWDRVKEGPNTIWKRKSDSLMFRDDYAWMAKKGQATFELTTSEQWMLEYAVKQRAKDIQDMRYQEFANGVKQEELK